jgi:hypothetical protein
VTLIGTPWRSQDWTSHATTAGSTSPESGKARGEVAEVRFVEWVTTATLTIGTT